MKYEQEKEIEGLFVPKTTYHIPKMVATEMEKVRKEKKKAMDYGAEYFLGIYNAKDDNSKLKIDEN